MYGKPFKMMGKSPMMKKLIGKQNNLPEALKAKIEASPEKPGPPMKDGSPMDMYGKSPAKKYKNAAPTRKYSPMKHDDPTKEDHEHPHLGTQDGKKGTYHSEKEYDFRGDYKGNKRLGFPSDQEVRDEKKRKAKQKTKRNAKEKSKLKLPTGVFPK